LENRLDEETTLHWHGLLVPSHLDGGPHNTIRPGGVWSPEIRVSQPAATTWFHPHPHGSTGRQVYSGLAGMMIVSDGGDGGRGLPAAHGVDDLPLIVQDKRFARSGALVYDPDMMDLMHGFQGDTLVKAHMDNAQHMHGGDVAVPTPPGSGGLRDHPGDRTHPGG
jgi:FtsP/CotA-like multicopper oxidase with cupredoxin domain